MVAVGVHDHLRVSLRKDGDVRVDCQWLPSSEARRRKLEVDAQSPCVRLPSSDDNLVTKALRLFQRTTGCAAGFDVVIQKRTPAAAGMGGASSDVAAALIAASRLSDRRVSHQELQEIAAAVGSDIPFFLGGDSPGIAARSTGRGEQIEPIPAAGHLWFLIVFPAETCSTAEVYRRCTVPPQPLQARPLVDALQAGNTNAIRRKIANRLAEPASQTAPIIRDTLKALARYGERPMVTGSGSACFLLGRNARTMRRTARVFAARTKTEVFCTTAVRVPGTN